LSKLKIILVSILIVFLSFSLFTLLRLPYERLLDRGLKSLRNGGVDISYKSAKVEPFKLKATLSEVSVKTGFFNLDTKSLEGELSLKELLLGFKISVTLRFSNGNITLPGLPNAQIPFNEGRAVLERGNNSLKVSELMIRGGEILIRGEIDGSKYDLKIKPSGSLERRLSPFLRFLQKDREGFYNLRSGI